jgi:polyisoprenoid-binding protein YceI
LKIASVLAGIGLLAASPAFAADWNVDTSRSQLTFSGVQSGAPFQGRFTRFEAHITFDPAKPEAGHATVLIDMASATTGNTLRDTALPQPDWFDTKSFPQARFEATSFRAKGDDAYDAIGTLTIRGISHAFVLPFSLLIDGNTAHVRGQTELTRTSYGVGQGSWSTGQTVALAVEVNVDLVATRVPGT